MKKHIAMLCAVLLTALAAFAPGAAVAGPALTATEAYCIIGIHHQGDDAGPCL